MQTVDTAAGAAAAAPELSSAQLEAIQARHGLGRQFKSGASWFYWIAGGSIVNSLIWWIGGGLTFLAGLAFTQIADGFLSALGRELGGSGQMVATVVALATTLLISGVFALFGYLATQGRTWAFYLGMAIYALDALIFLAFGEFLSFGFHLFALFGLWRGLRALIKLHSLTTSLPAR